jgi:hypothetical protein
VFLKLDASDFANCVLLPLLMVLVSDHYRHKTGPPASTASSFKIFQMRAYFVRRTVFRVLEVLTAFHDGIGRQLTLYDQQMCSPCWIQSVSGLQSEKSK